MSYSLRFIRWAQYYFINICIWEYLVWPVTLTTLAQWQRTRKLGQPITGIRQSCMSFLPRLQPAPCFVCLSAHQQWNRGVYWLGTNGGNLSWLPAHEDSGNRRGRTEQDRKGAVPGLRSQVLLDESLTRHILPGDKRQSQRRIFPHRRSSSPPLPSPLLLCCPPRLQPTDHGPGDSAALSHPQCSILGQHDQQQCGGGKQKSRGSVFVHTVWGNAENAPAGASINTARMVLNILQEGLTVIAAYHKLDILLHCYQQRLVCSYCGSRFVNKIL